LRTLTLKDATQFLADNDNYLIVTHRNPDGDTLGASAALCCALRDFGKTAYMLENTQVTRKYIDEVKPYWAPNSFEPEIVVSVDVASAEMLQKDAPSDIVVDLAIDHHSTHTPYAERLINEPKLAACGELVCKIIKEMNVPLSPDIARYLYIALATDTGCFCYKNVKPETLRTAAELMESGANAGELNHRLFMVKTLSRLELESQIIEHLDLRLGGQLAIAAITLDMMQRARATEHDLDDIATIAGQPDGVEMSITLREQDDGVTKISVRTVKYPNANILCVNFGGGGHGYAAGARIELPIKEAKAEILKAVDKVWGKGGATL